MKKRTRCRNLQAGRLPLLAGAFVRRAVLRFGLVVRGVCAGGGDHCLAGQDVKDPLRWHHLHRWPRQLRRDETARKPPAPCLSARRFWNTCFWTKIEQSLILMKRINQEVQNLIYRHWRLTTLKSTSVSVWFRGISRLPSAFVFFAMIQTCTYLYSSMYFPRWV